jgi:leader peptidase (prepilin peptidase) / N-methyltransferase
MSVDAIAVASFTGLGLILGWFLNVVVYRLPLGMSVVRPRSACPTCRTPSQGRDSVPVLSYLLLRGRCRTCHTHISAGYPIVEAITGALFGLAALTFRHHLVVAAMIAPFLGVMLAAALIDLRHRIIPNALTYPSFLGLLAAVVAVAFSGEGVSLAGGGLGLLAYGGGLLIVALVAPAGMGMGDVKLAAIIGLVLGALGLRYVGVAALLAVFGGGAGAIGALIAGRGRKDTIPFGPFLAAGAIVAALLAPQIARWYTDLFV